jgi:hypothetical protein
MWYTQYPTDLQDDGYVGKLGDCGDSFVTPNMSTHFIQFSMNKI